MADDKSDSLSYYNKIIKKLNLFSKAVSRTTITGEQNIPLTGGVIIAPNHISNIDPILLGVKLAQHRRTIALAKESLFRAPIIGKVMLKMGHVPVHRGSDKVSESLAVAEQLIRDGEAVAVYPEGTIPRENKGRLGKLKTGAARLALKTSAHIIPVGQWGAQNVMPLTGNPLWSIVKALFTKPKHVIIVGEPLPVSSYASIEKLNSDLADRIEALTSEARRISDPKMGKKFIRKPATT